MHAVAVFTFYTRTGVSLTMINITGDELELASPSVAFDTSTPVKCGEFFAPFYFERQAFLSSIKDIPV